MLRVSVIVPTYNRANYLPEALRSILTQSYSPCEVIVVDDGSTDDTDQVLQAFGSPVRYFKQDHQGVAIARNRGLELATGDVIAWLDADDLWMSDYLATVIPVLEHDSRLDGVYCGFTHIDAEDRPLTTPVLEPVPPDKLYSALIGSDFILTSGFVARKKCFDQAGNFDAQFCICEDYDLFLRFAQRFTFVGIPRSMVMLRVHDANTTRDTAAFCRFRVALVEKHWGPREGDASSWSVDKQCAYAHAFLNCAVRYFQDGRPDEGWHYFEEAVLVWPDLMRGLDTFFELVVGDQPRGRREQATELNVEARGVEVLRHLDTLFAGSGRALRAERGVAYGNAYLALAILGDQAGYWGRAREYLLRAIAANPRLLASYPVVRRLVKLFSGQRVIRWMIAWRNSRSNQRFGLGA
jgi:glycosyltransferase involved in cell wall biosynthesis